MGPAGADRLKDPVTDLLIDGEAGLKHRGGAAGIEDGADRRGDRGQRRELDQHHVGAGDVHQLVAWSSRAPGAGPAQAAGCRVRFAVPGGTEQNPWIGAYSPMRLALRGKRVRIEETSLQQMEAPMPNPLVVMMLDAVLQTLRALVTNPSPPWWWLW